MSSVLNKLKDLILWTVPVIVFFLLFGLGLFLMNVNFNMGFLNIGPMLQRTTNLLVPAQSIFLAILVESFPFVILGALLSSLIQQFVSQEWLLKRMPNNRLGASLLAGLLGIVVPVCDCGTIPIARSLLSKGVPRCAAITFVLAAPVVNPVTIVATIVAFGMNLHLAIMRVVITYTIACVVGILAGGPVSRRRLLSLGQTEVAATDTRSSEQDKSNIKRTWSRLKSVADHTVTEFFGIAGFLICSAAVASIYQVYHTRHSGFGHVHTGVLSVATMMGLGILFSLCSEADAFVARSFSVSYAQGAVLSFMLIGQMTDLRNLFLLPKTFGARTAGVIVVTCIVLCALCGIII